MGQVSQREAQTLSARRALTCLAGGAAVGAVVLFAVDWELFPLVTWTVASAAALVSVWRTGWSEDHRGTKRLAEAESRTRSTDTGVLIAAVVSLAAVVLALTRASSSGDPVAVALVILSILAVILSWALVNTVFALKYARMYYNDEDTADGGIDFNLEHPPAYCDFAYMAFMIGMAYSAADVEPATSRIRKAVLGHALLSFLFGTGILAVAINLVANLGGS